MTEQPDDRFLHAVRAEPRPEFAARLAAHLGSGVATPHRSRLRFRSLRHGRTIVSLAAVAVLLLALGLSAFWLSRGSQQVSAQEVLRKVVTLNVDDLGIQTYHLRTESDISFPAQFNGDTPVPGARIHSTSTFERWVSLPNRWRTDFRDASQPFIPGTDRVSGSVSDGTTEWSYNQDPAGSEYDVQIGALRPDVTPPALRTIPLPVGDLQPGQAVGVAGNDQRPGESPMRHAFLSCYQDARITGTATIAGRQAYMIDLGPDSCPPGYRLVAGGTPIPMATLPPAQQGRHTLWVDKQLSVVLKLELFNGDGSLQGRSEVTAFAVNPFIPESVFTFAPPPEVTHPQVTDRRPQPYQLPGSAISCDGCTMPGLVYPSPTPRPPAAPTAVP